MTILGKCYLIENFPNIVVLAHCGERHLSDDRVTFQKRTRYWIFNHNGLQRSIVMVYEWFI